MMILSFNLIVLAFDTVITSIMIADLYILLTRIHVRFYFPQLNLDIAVQHFIVFIALYLSMLNQTCHVTSLGKGLFLHFFLFLTNDTLFKRKCVWTVLKSFCVLYIKPLILCYCKMIFPVSYFPWNRIIGKSYPY